jgi:hypothetical protein
MVTRPALHSIIFTTIPTNWLGLDAPIGWVGSAPAAQPHLEGCFNPRQ